MKIDTSKWKPFLISSLFECRNGKMYEYADLPQKNAIEYYTSSESNNGFAGYIYEYSEEDVIKVPSLTVGSRGNDAITYYHEGYYIANQNLTVLIPRKNISKLSMLFVATVIRCEKYRYSYGRLMGKEKVAATTIFLPATASGDPDWDFMEEYMGGVAQQAFDNFEQTFKYSFKHK